MSIHDHLASGATHICRAWALYRRDGVRMGFTDHDRDLVFGGITFRAGAGMSAMAVQQTTGLSVDNSETLGALSADAITARDITAGRYDGAEIRAWLVRWDDVATREMQFRGHIGEIRKQGGSFSAELRGLTDALNQPGGQVFQRAAPTGLSFPHIPGEDWLMAVPRRDGRNDGGSLFA